MSRVANNPIKLPKGVEVSVNGSDVTVKGNKGVLGAHVYPGISLHHEGDSLQVKTNATDAKTIAMSGTTRANLNNMVIGVSTGFEKKLVMVGVGYRASVSGNSLNLSLGFSHPVVFSAPDGITIETPSQTEILIKGCDKQQVGQVAANIRSYRPPEPYKGKGVRYSDETVVRKEAKKK